MALLWKLLAFLVFASSSAIQLSTSASSSNSTSTLPKIPFLNSTKNLHSQLNALTNFDQQQSSDGNICLNDFTCYSRNGTNSRCYKNRCICDLGYRSVDSYCYRKYCTYNHQCEYFPNTVCQATSTGGRCVCDQNSQLDTESQTCKPTYLATCTTNSDCWDRGTYGFNSFCNSSLCDCEMGYTRETGCASFYCQYNFECSSRWPNTKCNFFGSCKCEEYYELNSVTQKCFYVESGGGGGDGTFIGITIIVLVIIITLSSCIAVCSKSGLPQGQRPQPQRRVYRQPTASNSTSQLSPSAGNNRRLPMPRLTVPNASSTTFSSQTMETPPPAYSEAVEGSNVSVQVFPNAQPPRYDA